MDHMMQVKTFSEMPESSCHLEAMAVVASLVSGSEEGQQRLFVS